MSAAQETLQEFLVKLGFKTDQISLKKFEDGLGKTGKSVLKTGLAVAGLVTAVEGATVAFAYSMRKMYFDSQVSGATVSNLRAVGYAAKAVGIDAEAMQDTIKGVGINMRLSPGLQGLAKSMGINSRDPTDVTEGVVNYTLKKKMPAWVGAQYAQMFGIGAEQYLHLRDNPGALRKGINESKKIDEELGIDPDKAAADAKKLTDSINLLSRMLDSLSTAFLGWTLAFNVDVLNSATNTTKALAQLLSDDPKIKEQGLLYFKEGFTEKSRGAKWWSSTTPEEKAMGAATEATNFVATAARQAVALVNPWDKVGNHPWRTDQTRLGDTTTNTSGGNTTITQNIDMQVNGTNAPEIAKHVVKNINGAAARTVKRKIE